MKSIISVIMSAVLLLSALTACARTNTSSRVEEARVTPESSFTTAPATTPGAAMDGDFGRSVGNAMDNAGNAAGDVVGGVGDAVGDVVGGVGNAVNDMTNGVDNSLSGMDEGKTDNTRR